MRRSLSKHTFEENTVTAVFISLGFYYRELLYQRRSKDVRIKIREQNEEIPPHFLL